MKRVLSNDSKQQLAMALILLKDWKMQSCKNFEEKIEMMKYVTELARAIDVHSDFEHLLGHVPAFRITRE